MATYVTEAKHIHTEKAIPMSEPFVRPDVRAFLDFLNNNGAPPISQLTPEEGRGGYRALKAIGDVEPRPLATVKDLTCPGPAGDIPLRLYDPRESRGPGPALVFYHGGGFVIGDLDTHDSLCRELAAELDLPLVAVDYRLAPENPFPAAPDDAEAATRWIAGSPAELGREVSGLIPIGDSAGGNLAIVVTQALADEPAAVPVILQVAMYPATDEREGHESYAAFSDGFILTRDTMEYFMSSYRGEVGNPRAFPIAGDHAKAPPTVLVTASLDPLRDSGRAYAAQLVRAGIDVTFVEMKGTVHGFTTLRKALPSANDDVARIIKAIRYMLDRNA